MGVSEVFEWIARWMIIILSALALITFLSVLVPSIDAEHVRADALGARILYDGGFTIKPGLVAEENFTQAIADSVVIPTGELIQPWGAIATLDIAGEEKEVVYNTPAITKLRPIRNVRGVDVRTWSLPVSVVTDAGITQGTLTVEVLYES